MDGEQLNIFEMIGMDETPEIPFEEQKKGTKGWIIQICGLFTTEYGWKRNMIGVTVRHMMLNQDPHTDQHGRWQSAWSIDRCKGDGWMGEPRKLYARKPTWKECVNHVKENHRGEPYEYDIVFCEKGGDALHRFVDYEEWMKGKK